MVFVGLCMVVSIKSATDEDEQPVQEDSFAASEAAGAPLASSPDSSTAGGNEVAEAQSVISEEEQGDTGNWLKKKEWVKQARELDSAIQELVLEAQTAKVALYKSKGTGIAEELENFHKEVGMGYGEIDAIVAQVQEYLDKRIAKAQQLKNDESVVRPSGEVVAPLSVYELQDQVDARKLELEQFKLDMKYIADLDKALSERINKVDEMVTYVFDHAKQAGEILTKMWHIVDHNKARLRYYEMNDHYEKIKAATAYIKNDLSENFDKISAEIKNQMAKCLESIKKLEDKDLIIKNRQQRVEDLKAQKKSEEQARIEAEKKSNKPRKKVQAAPDFWSFEGISAAANDAIGNFFEWVGSFISGAPKTIQLAERKNKKENK